MIGKLQDELGQLENKQANGTTPHATIRWELRAKNAPNLF